MHGETLITWLTQEGRIIAWLAPGVLLGILGIPRAPWRRWVFAAVLIIVMIIASVLVAYFTRGISFGTAPLLSLLIASAAGALCIFSVHILPERIWWPFFRDPDYSHDKWILGGLLLALVCAVMFADLVLWAWVRDPSAHQPGLRASIAATLQVLVLLPIAGLQAYYMGALQQREDCGHKRSYMAKQELAYGKVVWSRLIGLGIPTAVLVLSMVGEVIARNTLNNSAGPAAWHTWPLLVVFAVSWAMLLAVRFYVKAPQRDLGTLDLPLSAVIPIIVAVMGVSLAVYMINHVFFQIGWTVAMAVIYGAATADSLFFHTAWEHLLRPRTGVATVIAATAASSALLMLWLLSCALWSSGRALYAPRAVSITMLVLVGNSVLVWTIGSILAVRRLRNFSGYTTEQNLGADLLSHAGLGLMLAVLPDLLVGYLKYVPHDERLLALLVSALFLALPALGFVKVLFNAVNHMLNRKDALNKKEVKIILPEGEPPASPQDSQLHDRRVRHHFNRLMTATLLATAVSVIWILSAALYLPYELNQRCELTLTGTTNRDR